MPRRRRVHGYHRLVWDAEHVVVRPGSTERCLLGPVVEPGQAEGAPPLQVEEGLLRDALPPLQNVLL